MLRLRLSLKAWLYVSALVLTCAVACWVALAEIEATRHELVQMRLRTAVDIVRGRAAAALLSTDARPLFFEDLRRWSEVTGLRLTLILPDGSVLADTEVSVMPNLAERPEVRAATAGRTQVEFRRSVMTGKETLYVAAPIEVDGERIGILRAATDATEIDGVLFGFEYTFAVIAALCVGAGAIVGFGLSLGGRSRRVRLELVSDERGSAAALEAGDVQPDRLRIH